MRQSQSFLVIVLGLLLLWLAVTGRLEAVWSAALGAATGAGSSVPVPAAPGGTGGIGGTTGSGPILGVRLPDYTEYLIPSRDRFVPDGSGDYRQIKGEGWTRYFLPVTP